MSTEEPELYPAFKKLSELVAERPEKFGTGDHEIQVAALTAAKYAFDMALRMESTSIQSITDLLASLSPSQAPQTRSQTRKMATEITPQPTIPPMSITPIPVLHVEGMDDDQIWAQLELKNKGLCETLQFALDAAGEDPELPDGSDEALENDDSDMEDFMSESEEQDSEEDPDTSSTSEGMDDEDLGEDIAELRDSDDSNSEEPPTLFSHIDKALKKSEKPTRRRSELDDGFFDLRDFNAEITQAEAKNASSGALGDDDEEDGMDVIDLFQPVDTEELDDIAEPNYQDFFAPPPRTSAKPTVQKNTSKVRFHDEVRVKNIKPRGKNLPTSTVSMFASQMIDDDDEGEDEDFPSADSDEVMLDADSEEDLPSGSGLDTLDDDDGDESDEDQSEEGIDDDDDPMLRFENDLFAEENDTNGGSDLTTHERRQAELRAQIDQLESENIAKKDWTLMGEANARSRPQNSLLEEDLEFERVSKVTPVVTEDVVRRLEDRIKARILAGDFDDVVRQRAPVDKAFLPSRVFELQDTKSKQSLAEIYEDEYSAAQTGGPTDDRDGKLKKEHDELTNLWDSICYKLDALSNAHFTPKQPKATISTVSNVASASMESALPSTIATSTMLAPEEVFASSSRSMRAKNELTPEEKRAQRNKDKKIRRKQRDHLDSTAKTVTDVKKAGSVKKQKEAALKSVVKSGKGVTVVGKTKKSGSKPPPK